MGFSCCYFVTRQRSFKMATYSTLPYYSEIRCVLGGSGSVYHEYLQSDTNIIVTDNNLTKKLFGTVVIIHCGGIDFHACDNVLNISIFPHAIGPVDVDGASELRLVNIHVPKMQLQELAKRQDVIRHWAKLEPVLTILHLGKQDIFRGFLRNGIYPDGIRVSAMLGEILEEMFTEGRLDMDADAEFMKYKQNHIFMICPIPQGNPKCRDLQESGLMLEDYEIHRRAVNYQFHKQCVHLVDQCRALYLHFDARYLGHPWNSINVIWRSVGRYLCSHPDCHFSWACNREGHCRVLPEIKEQEIRQFAYDSRHFVHEFNKEAFLEPSIQLEWEF